MRKKTAFILLLLFISNSTTLNQLMKLPLLVTHFMEHRERDNQLSIVEFLSMHYWGKDIDDHDDDRDRQLPFKTIDTHVVQSSFVPFAKSIILKREDVRLINIHYPVLNDNFLPNPALSSLFRPPRA